MSRYCAASWSGGSTPATSAEAMSTQNVTHESRIERRDDRHGGRDRSACNKWYGEFHVLRDINLTVARGERIVICGPSGSRQIDDDPLHQPAGGAPEGQIVVDGIELTNDLKKIDEVRREVGMVFQQFNLFPHLTVLENLTLAPIWVRKMPKKEAEELAMNYLTRVQDPRAGEKYPGQLSGGQQQRVAIARALCMNPKHHAVRRADLGARSRNGQGSARRDGRTRRETA